MMTEAANAATDMAQRMGLTPTQPAQVMVPAGLVANISGDGALPVPAEDTDGGDDDAE
jgi:hypothetical protein